MRTHLYDTLSGTSPFLRLSGMVILGLIFSCALSAQADTLQRDELLMDEADTLLTLASVQRNPRNALLWAAIPGGGQVYNRRWWKVPLVYGGLLGIIAYADFNQTRYVRFRTALENRCLGDGNVIRIPESQCFVTDDEFPQEQVSDQALITARDNADRGRQTAYIGIFVVYLLQAVEAYSDAHLQEFDISDDLSIRLQPTVQPDGTLAAGLVVPLGGGAQLRRQEREVQRLRSAR
ncbi:DUF5683 domain-containing protein [Lewinella sp. W8]|uniref:DUF5683 domain-containing protein n=1 Tax=Lewinella sp. W8 TaxID=2528208 RepID=UPI0010685FBC|nr:DUF5683 domain-containing protein [Lewinella sp. W8]MTB51262.1 hypothetical protein [Lewinella sp. W8]